MVGLTNSRRNRPDLFGNSEKVTDVIRSLFFKYWKYRENNGQRRLPFAGASAYFRHLENIVIDLYAAWEGDPTRWVGYSRGRQNFLRSGSYWDFRKDEALLSKNLFLNLIDFLSEQGYIENHVAKRGYNPYSSRMRANPKLIELLKAEDVNWASIRTDTSISAIVVKDENKKEVPPPEDGDFDLAQAQQNLQRINDNLQWSLINLNITDEMFEALRMRMSTSVEDEGEPHDLESIREPLEFQNRSLKRIFALGSFDYGGRFYGGWWQGVPSEYRKFIELEGLLITEMDFSTIQPRILYAKAGANPPEDSYSVSDWDDGLRPEIKKAFNQLINSSAGSRNENQWHRFSPDMPPDPMPKNWNTMKKPQRAEIQRKEFRRRTGREYRELLHDLKAMHEPIDKFFFSQAWAWLQRIDSDIAEKVMLKMLDQQYTALPIHDSFIVRAGAEKVLINAMNEAFDEVVGTENMAKVKREPAVYDGKEENRPRVVDAHDFIDEVRRDLSESKGYQQREAEWRSVWGNWGYE